MTLTLPLTPQLHQRLAEEAGRSGVTPEEYALRLLDGHLQPAERGAKLAALLQSWMDEGDAEEQEQTDNELIRALDEDRPSERKLFPPELEGVTW